jgi:hypothetical protein
MSEIAEIEEAVLRLPMSQRVRLAQSLLDSLALPSADVSDAAELEEAEHRERQIAAGQVQPISEAELWRRVAAERPA